MRFDVLREYADKTVCDILHDIGPAELRERPCETISDVQVDLGRALTARTQSIVDAAACSGSAARVAAAALNRTGTAGGVAVDHRGTVKLSGDRADFNSDFARKLSAD